MNSGPNKKGSLSPTRGAKNRLLSCLK